MSGARFERRAFLIGAGTAVAAACGGASPERDAGTDGGPTGGADGGTRADASASTLTCSAASDGPGLGYCLVEGRKMRVVGAKQIKVGELILAKTDDDNSAALVLRDAGGFYALSGICTLACCIVTICGTGGACAPAMGGKASNCLTSAITQLDANGPAFLCVCHGSEFNRDGSVVNGPASIPLPSVPMEFDGDDVLVDLGTATSKDKRY